jgi:hypothetical protein
MLQLPCTATFLISSINTAGEADFSLILLVLANRLLRAIQGNFEFMLPLDSGPAEDDDQVQPGKFALNRFLSDGLALDGFEAGEGECSPNPSSHENAESDVESEGEDDEVDDEDVSGAYREIIINSPAYSWLIANLQRETLLTRANPDFLKELEDRVLSALPTSHRVSRRISSQAYKATFELDWDPMLFVREQDYVENPSDALERAITLTGQMNDAQAATTRAYLSQTWPTTGGHAMQLVTDVVGNTTGEPATSTCITAIL